MTMQLNLRYMQALAKHVAPKYDIRTYLSSVLVEINDERRHYVATDGHIMAVLVEPRQDSDTNGQYVLERTDILRIKPFGSLDTVGFDFDGLVAKLQYAGSTLTTTLIDCR